MPDISLAAFCRHTPSHEISWHPTGTAIKRMETINFSPWRGKSFLYRVEGTASKENVTCSRESVFQRKARRGKLSMLRFSHLPWPQINVSPEYENLEVWYSVPESTGPQTCLAVNKHNLIARICYCHGTQSQQTTFRHTSRAEPQAALMLSAGTERADECGGVFEFLHSFYMEF